MFFFLRFLFRERSRGTRFWFGSASLVSALHQTPDLRCVVEVKAFDDARALDFCDVAFVLRAVDYGFDVLAERTADEGVGLRRGYFLARRRFVFFGDGDDDDRRHADSAFFAFDPDLLLVHFQLGDVAPEYLPDVCNFPLQLVVVNLDFELVHFGRLFLPDFVFNHVLKLDNHMLEPINHLYCPLTWNVVINDCDSVFLHCRLVALIKFGLDQHPIFVFGVPALGIHAPGLLTAYVNARVEEFPFFQLVFAYAQRTSSLAKFDFDFIRA